MKFGKKIVQKRAVFLKLFRAMLDDWITWREMTERMEVELLIY